MCRVHQRPKSFLAVLMLERWTKNVIKSAKLAYLRGILGRMKYNSHSASDLWQAVNQTIGRSNTIKSKLSRNLSLDSINNFSILLPLLQNIK